MKRILLILITAIISAAAMMADDTSAATVRPVTSQFIVGAGSSHMADTYLSPLKYSGWQADFTYRRYQAMRFDPERWVMRLSTSVQLDHALSSAHNTTMWYAGIEASWGMTRRFTLPEGFSAGVGGITELCAGALLKATNGNNPVAAKADWTVGVATYGAWHGKLLGRLPVTLRLDASMPVAGVFFSPDYGELYYEIWLGNRSNLVHPAWWGNFFRLDTELMAQLHFGGTTLLVGYGFAMHTTDVNNIISRSFRHSARIGVASEWISLSAGTTRLSDAARVISAYY